MEKGTNLSESKICEAIDKGTAFIETYKGWIERVLCEEEKCLKGYKNRFAEDKCTDKVIRYICPLYEEIKELSIQRKSSPLIKTRISFPEDDLI